MTFQFLAVLATQLVLAGAPAANAGATGAPAPVARLGSSEKICQLTGDTDWETGQPTAARTLHNFGLRGVDLGFPVEYARQAHTYVRRYLSLQARGRPRRRNSARRRGRRGRPPRAADQRRQVPGAANSSKARRNRGVCCRHHNGADPDQAGLLQRALRRRQRGGQPVRILLHQPLHACRRASSPLPTTRSPARRRARPARRTTIAAASEEASWRAPMMRVEPSAASCRCRPASSIPSPSTPARNPICRKNSVWEFWSSGSPRYRAGIPYLAQAPAESFADPATWRFFTGRAADGRPKWVTLAGMDRRWSFCAASAIRPDGDRRENRRFWRRLAMQSVASANSRSPGIARSACG